MLLPGNQSLQLLETSSSEPADQQSAGLEAMIVPVVFGLIFVVGLIGNCLVMLVMGKGRYGNGGRVGGGRNPSSPTKVFILNLCAADLLFLIFCVPLHATIYSLPEWLFGAFLCKFAHFFSTVGMLVSIFTLASMSVDRYVAVVRSGTSSSLRSRRNALAALCIIWTLSLVCLAPVAQHQVLVNHPRAPNSTFCWEEWSGASKRSYKVSVLLLGFLLPLLLISCCYIRVSLWTRPSTRALLRLGDGVGSRLGSLSSSLDTPQIRLGF